jgi:hypothetical protein
MRREEEEKEEDEMDEMEEAEEQKREGKKERGKWSRLLMLKDIYLSVDPSIRLYRLHILLSYHIISQATS